MPRNLDRQIEGQIFKWVNIKEQSPILGQKFIMLVRTSPSFLKKYLGIENKLYFLGGERISHPSDNIAGRIYFKKYFEYIRQSNKNKYTLIHNNDLCPIEEIKQMKWIKRVKEYHVEYDIHRCCLFQGGKLIIYWLPVENKFPENLPSLPKLRELKRKLGTRVL